MDLKPEDVERWARESDIPCDGAAFGGRPLACLERFADMAYAAGLEEAARICDSAHYAEVAAAEIRRLKGEQR